MNSLISAVLLLQFFAVSIANHISVGNTFAAAVEYQSLLSAEVTDEPGTVTAIPTRSTLIVMAHYGFAGTAFHSFRRGDLVSFFDADGIEHRYVLTRSWTRAGPPLISISRRTAIVFVTCTDMSGTETLYWAGQRLK